MCHVTSHSKGKGGVKTSVTIRDVGVEWVGEGCVYVTSRKTLSFR